jgi:DNA end-binding protein Ku
MAQRAYWEGYIRLSLVTFPVRLYAAVTETEKIRLHKIDRNTGKRIHYQNITDDESIVDPSDIIKGYEYEKDRYVTLENNDLKKLRVESTHMIDLVQFVDIHEIDPIYFEKPYFVVPAGRIAEEAFITLRESLNGTRKIALGQITLGGKERIAAIKPSGRGLVLETLRYANEVRRPEDFFNEIPDKTRIPEEQAALAEELIRMKAGHFDPSAFKDNYQEGLLALIEAKLHHKKLPATRQRPVGNVVNIMDALKKSLAQSERTEKTSHRTPARKPAARKRTRREKS